MNANLSDEERRRLTELSNRTSGWRFWLPMVFALPFGLGLSLLPTPLWIKAHRCINRRLKKAARKERRR